jgi:plastocyanin
MSKQVLVLALLLIVAGLLLASRITRPPPHTEPQQVIVALKNSAFQPRTTTIQAGDRLIWIDQDPIEHTVTSDTGAWESIGLAPDGSTAFRPLPFDTPGVYPYHCEIHADMTGTIIVQ